MKYIVLLISMIVAGCNTSPSIIPDTSGDNVVMLQLKDQISQPGGVKASYGWVFWYVPIVIISSLLTFLHIVSFFVLTSYVSYTLPNDNNPFNSFIV